MPALRSPIAHRYRFRPEVLAREVAGEAVLLDLASGSYFGLNATGARIWELLVAAEGEVREIPVRLADEYALPLSEAEAGVEDLLRQLEAARLVDRAG